MIVKHVLKRKSTRTFFKNQKMVIFGFRIRIGVWMWSCAGHTSQADEIVHEWDEIVHTWTISSVWISISDFHIQKLEFHMGVARHALY